MEVLNSNAGELTHHEALESLSASAVRKFMSYEELQKKLAATNEQLDTIDKQLAAPVTATAAEISASTSQRTPKEVKKYADLDQYRSNLFRRATLLQQGQNAVWCRSQCIYYLQNFTSAKEQETWAVESFLDALAKYDDNDSTVSSSSSSSSSPAAKAPSMSQILTLTDITAIINHQPVSEPEVGMIVPMCATRLSAAQRDHLLLLIRTSLVSDSSDAVALSAVEAALQTKADFYAQRS
jgi:hypothetical protein